MPKHIELKRLTRLKTYNIKEENWEKTAEWLKRMEYLGEQTTKAIRNAKKHLKELHKLYNDNEKKRNKNKLTKKDCEKEGELADKIDLYILHFKKFFLDIGKTEEEYDDSIITKSGKINSNCLHTIKSDTSQEKGNVI